jgi:signal transduction histidine kinase
MGTEPMVEDGRKQTRGGKQWVFIGGLWVVLLFVVVRDLPWADSQLMLATCTALAVLLLSTVAVFRRRSHGSPLLEARLEEGPNPEQYERELMRVKEAAESAGRAKSEFLANMSHELRTPLSVIIGFTQLNLGKQFGPLTPLQEESLGDVLRSARHLLSLINDLLDLSKMESGTLHLDLTIFRLRDTLERSLLIVKEKAAKQQVGLSVHIGDIPERVMADERKLKQILYSLLENGIKFTPSNGEVCLRAESGDGLLHISVEDNGIGIRKEDLERIFKPFTQVDGSYSRHHSGAGIGLSMARELVELHGGRIWAESEGEGRGTTFRVVIPAALPPVSGKIC